MGGLPGRAVRLSASVLLLGCALAAPRLAPGQTAEQGRAEFQRLLGAYPWLSEPEVHGLGTKTPPLTLWVPEPAWNSLSPAQRQALGRWVASLVPGVRAAPERYVSIPRTAPIYRTFRDRAATLCNTCWAIGVGRLKPDGCDMYFDRLVVEGR